MILIADDCDPKIYMLIHLMMSKWNVRGEWVSNSLGRVYIQARGGSIPIKVAVRE